MVTRACISINNRCNLNCTYCHFHEKKDYIQEDNMDVITILDIIASHIEDNDIDLFKLSLPDFNAFLNKAMERLNVRTGGYDCTMYGGMCGAGMDNIFYANGKIFICGNCIDLPFSMPYDTPLNEVSFDVVDFDRSCCFKEVFTG